MRLAVVGSGISGVAAAWLLQRRHDVHLFERDSRLGGHTHTIDHADGNGTISLDSGFIVFNHATYPHLKYSACWWPDGVQDLAVFDHWRLDGRHYQRTLEAWLDRMDRSRGRIMPTLREAYGDDATIWWQRWRMFFMACSELFGYRKGQERFVSHYLLGPRAAAAFHPEVETRHLTREATSVVSIDDHRQRGQG
jgi:glycine/D-amino acid oxidase-like deaminating enzyme